jgi:DinB family protein
MTPGSVTSPFTLAEACAMLERTPTVLHAWLAGLPDAWVRADEGPETWSPFHVVGHLIDGEETDWIPRARIILAQGPDRRFTPFDRFRHRRMNAGRSLPELLDRFAALRVANMVTLRGWRLAPAQLALTGEHPELGTVTLEQLLATWVAHDLDHLMQIARVMGKRYVAATGPWPAYLRVLRS